MNINPENIKEILSKTVLHKCHYRWARENLTIVKDGHHPETGQRVSIIEEDVPANIISNALVVSLNYYKELVDERT